MISQNLSRTSLRSCFFALLLSSFYVQAAAPGCELAGTAPQLQWEMPLVSELSQKAVTLRAQLWDPALEVGSNSARRDAARRPLVIYFSGAQSVPVAFPQTDTYRGWLDLWSRNPSAQIPRLLVLNWGSLGMLLDEISPPARRYAGSQFLKPLQLLEALKKILKNPTFANVSRKVLVGGSLGALNALQLASAQPSFFHQLVLYALPDFQDYNAEVRQPALNLMGPAFWDELNRDAGMQNVLGPLVNALYQKQNVAPLAHFIFGNEIAWQKYSFFYRLKYRQWAEGLNQLPIYLSTGDQDALGYFPANEAIARQMHGKGFRGEWRPVAAGQHTGPYHTEEIVLRMQESVSLSRPTPQKRRR